MSGSLACIPEVTQKERLDGSFESGEVWPPLNPPSGCLQADAGDWPFKTDRNSFVRARRIDGCALHFVTTSGRCCWRNQRFGLSWTCVRVKAAPTSQEDTCNCALLVRR